MLTGCTFCPTCHHARHALLASMLLRSMCPPCPASADRLLVTEDQAVGSVPWSIYGRYATRMGLPVVFLIAGKPREGAGCLPECAGCMRVAELQAISSQQPAFGKHSAPAD
jgi:hypothetical protein